MKNLGTLESWKFKLRSCLLASLLNISFLFSIATAQEAIITGGTEVSGIGGSLSYSLGQVVYQIHTGTNGSIAEGVQQPCMIPPTPAIKKAGSPYLSFTAFPNPTSDYLFLNVKNFNDENLSFQIIDIHGKVLHYQKISDSQTSFYTGNLAPAIYCLQIMLDKKLIDTFKIIKIREDLR
jgi:hypothetical protein